MKWSETQIARLEKLCFSGVSNKNIAADLSCKVTDVYSKRSQLGITIDKVQNAQGKRGYNGKKRENLIFKNNNGGDYFIVAKVAKDGERALLREMSRGEYVIVRDLDWVHMCWSSGRYFGADKFEAAAKAFLGKGRGDDDW